MLKQEARLTNNNLTVSGKIGNTTFMLMCENNLKIREHTREMTATINNYIIKLIDK